MRPAFRIEADGADITGRLSDRLLSLVVTDAAGWQSDTAVIRLDDKVRGRATGGAIALPRKGAKLRIWLGLERAAFMGVFTVDELTVEGPPATVTISAKAADMRQEMKAPVTRSWHGVTVGDLVATVAARHGLSPRVAAELAGVVLDHVDQTEESDLHLLTRLAKDLGAVMKPAGGHLVFAPRGKAKSVSGQALGAVVLTPADVKHWSATLADRGRYGAVIAAWHDGAGAALREAKVEIGAGPARRMRDSYPSEAVAKAAAAAELEKLNRGSSTLSVTGLGNPTLAAEAPLTMTGFRTGIDGPWTITKATHRLDGSSGYTTEIEAEAKG